MYISVIMMYTGITFVMFVLFIYICIIYMYVLKISICIYKDSYNSPKWVQDSPFSVGTHQCFLILHFLQWFQDSPFSVGTHQSFLILNFLQWFQDSPFSVGTHQSFLILDFLQWFQDSLKFSKMSSTSVLIKIDCYKYSCIWSITCYQRKYTINNVN